MRTFLLLLLAIFSSAPAFPAKADTICTLVLDAKTDTALVDEGDCHSRVTPASTFKVALAVMAYDAGMLKDAHRPVMSFQSGDPDWGGANWTRDTDPADWLRFSVVWYSQRIAHAMGVANLTRYARDFGYGNADFSGDPGLNNGLDRAWIASSLIISPQEQAAFLRALVMDKLPVASLAMKNTRSIVEKRRIGNWIIHGKTGAAYPRREDRSLDYTHGWGWYVGWAQNGNRKLVFVRLTQATERTDKSPGNLTRDDMLRQWINLVEKQ